MKWTEQEVYGPVFTDLSTAPPSPSPSPTTDATTTGAKFSLLENDYVWGDRKVRLNATLFALCA